MPKPLSFGRFEMGLTAGMGPGEGESAAEAPMRILIMGDFSGQASRERERPEISERRPIVIDRDNLDQVIAKFGVELHLKVRGSDSRLVIRFRELEDFHPDRLYQRLELFQALRDLRSRLSDASTFKSAAEELRGWGTARRAEPAKTAPEQTPSPPPTSPEQLLEQILGGAPAPSSSSPSGSRDWQPYLRGVVEPHLAPKIDYSKQTQMVGLLDEVISQQMGALLHHPPFQALESAWRAVDFLVRRVETDADLKVYLLDVTKGELLNDLEAVDNLRDSGLYRLLVESVIGVPGAVPWGLVLGNFTFGQDREDVEFLCRLAKICDKAGAPFLAGASCRVLGVDSLAETPDPRNWHPERVPEGNAAWESLRRLPEACYLGLVLPRFLLRLPYGKDTSSTEQFEFEQTAKDFQHESYLWGNPAFVCGCLMAEAYARYGWRLRLGIFQDIEGLPLHSYEDRGEKEVKPCAEALLTERALEPILEKGLMPLLSFQGRDAVRLANFQSVAQPAHALAGRWQ